MTEVDLLRIRNQANLEQYEAKTAYSGPWFYIRIGAVALVAVYLISKKRRKK